MSVTGFPTAVPTFSYDNSVLMRIGARFWWHNQLMPANHIEAIRDLMPLAWCCVVAGALVLLHDLHLNRLKYSLVRLLVDIAAVGCFVSGLCIIIANNYSDKRYYVFLVNFGVSSWSTFLTKAPDNVVFVLGYKYINKNVPHWIYALFAFLIFLFIFSPYLLGIPIMPFIFNMNSVPFRDLVYLPCFINYSVAGIICNVYFSYCFVKILYDVNVKRKVRVAKQAQLFAMRCVVHGFASSIPVIYAPFAKNLPEADLVSSFILCISLHVLFNYKIEQVLLSDSFKIFQLWLRKRFGARRISVSAMKVVVTGS